MPIATVCVGTIDNGQTLVSVEIDYPYLDRVTNSRSYVTHWSPFEEGFRVAVCDCGCNLFYLPDSHTLICGGRCDVSLPVEEGVPTI